MNIENEKTEIEVSENLFKKFKRIYKGKLEANGFMGYVSYYDWELCKTGSSKKRLEKCLVCRVMTEYSNIYYIRNDIYEKYKDELFADDASDLTDSNHSNQNPPLTEQEEKEIGKIILGENRDSCFDDIFKKAFN